MAEPKKIEFMYADMTDDEWEQVRQMAEQAIMQGEFEKCPIRCVVNAYVTWLLIRTAEEEKLDEPSVH